MTKHAVPLVSSPERPGLLELVHEDYVAHGRRGAAPGFHALAVHRFGVARRQIEPRILRAPVSVLYRVLARAVAGIYGIELPDSAQIGRRVIFEHQHGIVVHGAAVIGDDCIIRHGVTLGMRSASQKDEAPVLGCGVNVGAGAKIIGLLRVGNGASIGANAVVLGDVPAGRLAVGVPAHLVDRRHLQQPERAAHPRVGDPAVDGHRRRYSDDRELVECS